jgi:hypothetical protein
MVGFEFVDGQYPARARLALALFGARATESRRISDARRALAGEDGAVAPMTPEVVPVAVNAA